MRKVYRMKNLDCANCAAKMERAIGKLKGVEAVEISFMAQKLILEAEEEIKSFVLRYDGIRYTYHLMEKYRQKAIDALKIFPDNIYKSSLIALLDYAINRMH